MSKRHLNNYCRYYIHILYDAGILKVLRKNILNVFDRGHHHNVIIRMSSSELTNQKALLSEVIIITWLSWEELC